MLDIEQLSYSIKTIYGQEMDDLNTISLESNKQIKINFDGGDLSSDAGLLQFKKFLFKIGRASCRERV